MTRRTWILLLAGGGVLSVGMCAGVGMTLRYVLESMSSAVEMQAADTPAPSVLIGAGVLEKTVVLNDPTIGTVTDLKANPLPDQRLGVAGTGGAVFVDAKGAASGRVVFADASPTRVDFVDVEGDGKWEFLNRGDGGWVQSSLIDGRGQTLWTHGADQSGVNDMAAGDLDADQSVDFVVAMNVNAGMRRLDSKGSVKWLRPEVTILHLEVVDVDGDGKPEIVYSPGANQIAIRDASGTVLRSFPIPGYCNGFSLCRWPTHSSAPAILFVSDEQFWLYDFNGNTLAQLKAPGTIYYGGIAYGTPVRLQKGAPEYLAVVLDSGQGTNSTLFVYAPDQKLVYHELILGRCGSLAAVPTDVDGVEDLYVGGTEVVWKYTWNSSSVQPTSGATTNSDDVTKSKSKSDDEGTKSEAKK